MSDISELERRIAAALDRIARAAEAKAPAPAAPSPAVPPEPEAEAQAEARASRETALREALEAERTANAQLNDRVRAIKDRQETMVSQIERKLTRASEQLDVQGLEMQRLKKANAQLAEANRRLIEAQAAGGADAATVARALQAELDAMHAARAAEIAELEDIMGELRPLAEGGTAHG